MGVVSNIKIDRFPKQGPWLGKRCEVCFHYDSKHTIGATVVRDDKEDPRITIFQLDDGRFVLATECQHTMPM